MLFDRHHRADVPGRGEHGLCVQRLDRVHAQDGRLDSGLCQFLGRRDGVLQHPAGGDERHVPAVPQGNGLTDLKLWLAEMHVRFARTPQAQVHRAVVFDGGTGGTAGLVGVPGGDDDHVGKDAEDGNILRGEVCHSQRPVGHAPADGDDLDIGLVIADVVSDLLQRPERGEIGDGVREADLPAQGHAGCQAGHVLLRHAGVEVLLGEPLGEVGDDAEAQVADDQHDPVVLGGQFRQGLNERRSHSRHLNSSMAPLSSVSSGAR